MMNEMNKAGRVETIENKPEETAPGENSLLPLSAAQCKAIARQGIKRNVGPLAGVAFLWELVAGLARAGVGFMGVILFSVVPEPAWWIPGLVLLLVLFGLVWAYKYGYANMGLKGAGGDNLRVGDGFIGNRQTGRAFACGFCVWSLALLWGLLLLVPGVVKLLDYLLTPYLMLENPKMGVCGAMKESRRLMDGNKMRAFWLACSFWGWWVVGLTGAVVVAQTAGRWALDLFCLAFYGCWLLPYQSIAFGAFYRDVAKNGRGA